MPFTLATSVLTCPDFTYTYTLLDIQNPTSATAPTFTLEQVGRISLQPVSFSNLGDYTLKITACFTLSSDNGDSTFTDTDLCADSAPFVVSIVNPYTTTTIEGGIFTDVMREPQLQTETLDLSARVPSGGWEWTTAVDSATAGSYGDNLCGLITYQVLEETSPGTYEAQTLVSKAGDILTFAPDLTHTPGPY